MIKERMLELLLMEVYNVNDPDLLDEPLIDENINEEKFNKHLKELREEFLRPYVIDNAPNGE